MNDNLPYPYRKLLEKIKFKQIMNYNEFIKEATTLRLSRKDIFYVLKELERYNCLDFNKRKIKLKRI